MNRDETPMRVLLKQMSAEEFERFGVAARLLLAECPTTRQKFIWMEDALQQERERRRQPLEASP